MKILVVSLLRLGDIILATPMISALKAKYKNCEIHILMNSQFMHVAPMLVGVDKIIPFERDQLQKGLGEIDSPFFEPYDTLNRLVHDLNAEIYDWVINTTHNRLSGWIVGMIESERKDGLSLANDGSPYFGTKWFELLNYQGSQQKEQSFHFSDIFCYGAGLKSLGRCVTLNETEKGIEEANRISNALSPYICLQPLTSDQKKNWGFDSFVRFAELFSQVDVGRTFVVLGAPSEEEQLSALSKKFHERKIRHKIAICSLEASLTLIKGADLFITCDTAIKHIASATQTPVVELSLGSSSYERTGCYSDKAVILQPLEPCAPCNHSVACPYESHRCADRLAPECVALVCQALLSKSKDDLRTVAQEFSDQVSIMRAEFSSQGEWKAIPVAGDLEGAQLMRWIDRSSQRLFLNDLNNDIIEFGSESLQLEKLFTSIAPDREKYQWVETYKELEKQCDSFQLELENLLSELKIVIRSFDADQPFEKFKGRMERLRQDLSIKRNFQSYVNLMEQVLSDNEHHESKFFVVKRMREVITSMHKRAEIESRLIKSMKTQLLERI